LGLQNRSTIEFTLPKQFVLINTSRLYCNISGFIYSKTIVEAKLEFQLMQSFGESSIMKCIGTGVMLIQYETLLDPTIMLVHLDNLEAVFQSFEPSFSRTVASPIFLNISRSVQLKAGSISSLSAEFILEQSVSSSSRIVVEVHSIFLNTTALIEFAGISIATSSDRNIASFLIASPITAFLALSMTLNNLTLPGGSGVFPFVSGYIVDVNGRKTHEIVERALSIQSNEFLRAQALCFPSCYAGESLPASIQIVTTNDMMEGSYLRVDLIGSIKMRFEKFWATVNADSAHELINSTALNFTFRSFVPRQSLISLQTTFLRIQNGPADQQNVLICSYTKFGSPIDCSVAFFVIAPSRMTLLFSSQTFASGVATSLDLEFLLNNELPSFFFCNITFNSKVSLQNIQINSKNSLLQVQSLNKFERIITVQLVLNQSLPLEFTARNSISLTVSNVSFFNSSAVCILNVSIFHGTNTYAVLDRVYLSDLFLIEANNSKVSTTNFVF
jgi:hypothetical protein